MSTSSFKIRLLVILLRYAVIALAILFALDRVFSGYIIVANPTTNYAKLLRLVYEDHPDEIPLLGSSTVLRGILPEQLGENFYNFGITATNFQKLEPMLRVELAKDKKTPVIIEMAPQFFFKRPKPNIRIEDFLPVNQNPYFKEFMKAYNFHEPWHGIPGARYFGEYTRYLGTYSNTALPPKLYFSKGGKILKKRTSKEEFEKFKEIRTEQPMNYSATPELIARFEDIVADTKRPIIVIVAPFHPIVYETGFSMGPYRELLQGWESKFPHLRSHIADGRTYDENLFLDTSHLNYWGAVKYSNELKDAFSAFGIIAQQQ